MDAESVLLCRGFGRLEVTVELVLSGAINFRRTRIQRRYHCDLISLLL